MIVIPQEHDHDMFTICREREQNSSGLWILLIAQMFMVCSHE